MDNFITKKIEFCIAYLLYVMYITVSVCAGKYVCVWCKQTHTHIHTTFK